MSFKKMIPFLFGVTLLSSGATVLANNINSNSQQETSIINFSENQNKSLNQHSISQLKSEKYEGESYWKWRFVYHYIGVKSSVLKKLDTAMTLGIPAVTGVISASFPVAAPVAAAFSALLVAQWKIWDPMSSDKGQGVEIQAIGVIPQVITYVGSQ